MRIDHVAIEVADFDDRLDLYRSQLGLVLRRMGRLARDPQRRIAMLADDDGTKIELVEGVEGADDADDRLLHVAFEAADAAAVDTVVVGLVAAGWAATTSPRRFEPARSRTATVERAGAAIQIVAYDADAPDARGAVVRATTSP